VSGGGVSSATRAAVANTYRQLLIVERQPAKANPLGPVLVALVNQLTTLTSIRLAAQSSLSVQPSTGSVPPVASLVKRIERLRHLLVDLSRIDPRSAHRLAPTLAALHALLSELLQMPGHVNPLSPVLPGVTPDVAGGPVASWPAEPAIVASAAPTSAQATGMPRQMGPRLVSDPERHLSRNRPFTSSRRGSADLPLNVLPAGGPSSSMGAPGSSAGTGAGTLASTSVVILLLGLLSGRLALVVRPRRLAVLRHRLERPG